MAKPAMQQLEGGNKNYNGAIHYLPCIFDTVQRQQQVKGCMPYSSLESERYKKECREIMHNLQNYAHMRIIMHGHPSPISLDKYCNLVLPPNLYDSLYLPWPMAPPCTSSPGNGQPTGAGNDIPMPAAAQGCTITATRMSHFATSSMEQDNETNWDSESNKPMQTFRPAGMSNYEDWAEDNLDMGDYPACADKPPTVRYSHIEGASRMAEAPATTTHPPNPMHLSMPESSPHTKDDVDVEGLTHKGR